jgi:hypothetical protein
MRCWDLFYEKLTKSEVFSSDNVINLFPVYYQIVNLLKMLQDIVWFYIYLYKQNKDCCCHEKTKPQDFIS